MNRFTQRRNKILASTAIVLIASFALTACTPSARIYARQEGDAVSFLSCEPGFEANQIAVDFSLRSSSVETVWQLDGPEIEIAQGSQYRTGQEVAGFTTSVPYAMRAEELGAGAFAIAFSLLDEDGGILRNHVASFDGAKLSEDSWIDTNGRAVNDPC